MDKKYLAALALGTALGAGGMAAGALLGRGVSALVAVKSELIRAEQRDGGVVYYQRTSFKLQLSDGGEQYGAQASGVVVDAAQRAACDTYWEGVVTQPQKLVSAQALLTRDAGK